MSQRFEGIYHLYVEGPKPAKKEIRMQHVSGPVGSLRKSKRQLLDLRLALAKGPSR
jgi:hypothetical protein